MNMQRTPLSPEERELREKYVEDKCKLFHEAETARNKYINAYLEMKAAHQTLLDIEGKMWTLLVHHVDNTEKLHHIDEANEMVQEWHPGSELPENPDKDTIYLAIGLNGKPFLTHWWTEKIWKETVVQWQYIDMPTNTPS